MNPEKSKSKTPEFDEEKKETALESAKVRCKVCFREISPKRLCGGHGGGGGGSDSTESKKEKTDAAESISLLQQVKPVPSTKADDSADFEARDGDIEPDFDPNTIAELLSQKLLFIENDRELMTLTIQCDPDLLSPKQLNEVNKFVQSILNEWNEFKKENPDAGQLTIKKDSSGNIFYFQATLSTQALYDAFMERLANRLVPNADLQDKTQRELGQEITTPTPFSTVPKPTVSKKTKEEERVSVKEKEEEEQKQDQPFNPSPFVLKPNPWKTGE